MNEEIITQTRYKVNNTYSPRIRSFPLIFGENYSYMTGIKTVFLVLDNQSNQNQEIIKVR